ncbi:hypothetical protein [Deinococcus ruber]|uniref:IrrE N-terminal-like domain-containing protein n=1 Tax=Deinococcus ruber TaxID=1848197 RepID=A0A918C0W7_9DEIO|nr:hypothetical protein [Deinococcus ruber]GGR00050.1 hypothetical protein GCM10008957_10920 [Deinococcus ruber]
MIIDPVTKLLSELVYTLEQMDYPTPAELARALGLKVVSGPVAAINLRPPPTIHLPDYLTGYRRANTLAHEIGHAMMEWRGIDAELLAYYAPECAYANLEALGNHIAGIIMMPPPLHSKMLRRFGFTPNGIFSLARAVGAPLPLAMDRVIYDSDSYKRAALLFQKGTLIEYATTTWLEVELYDYIADPADRFPGIQLLTLGDDEKFVLGTWGE